MLKKLELKNYKSHKHYVAEFNGNSIIEGNKGSGKTSLKDAFTWIMTGTLVDDPTPVDENGVIINHLTISAEATFESGLVLKVESSQVWSKEKITTRHGMTFFINGTPMIKRDYDLKLEEMFGTLEQRRIMLDPTWFAYGDGLAIGGKTRKTATQRRREIVIGVANMGDLEEEIAQNEEQAKQAKYAISQLKKQLDEANAGIESLHNAKVDTTYLDQDNINQEIKNLQNERESVAATLNSATVDNALQEAYNAATLALSNARAIYTEQYSKRLEQAQKPLQEYMTKKDKLRRKIEELGLENYHIDYSETQLIRDIDTLKKDREELLKEYNEVKEKIYSPDSVTCECCGQVLPPDKLREHEARFNKQRSDSLEKITKLGKDIAHDLKYYETQLANLDKKHDLEPLKTELRELKEPKVESLETFEETEEYDTLNKAAQKAYDDLLSGKASDMSNVYKDAIDNIDSKIVFLQEKLNLFKTNDHLDTEIEKKGEELQEIAGELDRQEESLEKANEFVRKTLTRIENDIEQKFDGIRFKMFEYTLDGTQKDTCITYGKTDVGYIPWESLSGGQKRSATIKLANTFAKAWDVKIPLWVDDTQIYTEDELNSVQQLIRITEVPHKELVVK